MSVNFGEPPSGGSGTINNGVPPQHAYYSGATTLDSDSNMRKGADGTELRAISYALVDGVTDQYYVATTGNDANAGTAVAPFLTIGRAMRQVNMNLRPGVIRINIADGTYNNTRFLAPPLLAVNQDATKGMNVIQIVGNTGAPGNVILHYDASTIVFAENSSTVLALSGLTLEGNNLGVGTYGIECQNSTVYLSDVDISSCRNGIYVGNNGNVIIESSANGGNIDAFDDCIIVDNGNLIVEKSLVLTGNRNSALLVRNNGVIDLRAGTSSITSGGTNCASNIRCEFGGVLKSVNGISFNLSDANTAPTSASLKIISGGSMQVIGGGFTFTNANLPAILDGDSTFEDTAATTYAYAGGTPTTWQVDESAKVFSTVVTGGASIINASPIYNCGDDFRYVDTIAGLHTGALPVGVTRYFTFSQVQANYIPIYLATRAEKIVQINVLSQVSNGAAQTDTYTVMKNGVATTMAVSVTNAVSGSSTTNPVTLANNDNVGIRLESAGATTAEDVVVQLIIRKIN